jgi:hypothetical protein
MGDACVRIAVRFQIDRFLCRRDRLGVIAEFGIRIGQNAVDEGVIG